MPLDIDGAGRSRTLAPTWFFRMDPGGPGGPGPPLRANFATSRPVEERGRLKIFQPQSKQNWQRRAARPRACRPPKTSDLPNIPPAPPFQGFLPRPLAFQGHRASDPKSFLGPRRQACLSMPSKTPRPSQGAFKASGPLQDRFISEPDGQSVDAQP